LTPGLRGSPRLELKSFRDLSEAPSSRFFRKRASALLQQSRSTSSAKGVGELTCSVAD
jgi:hypothetical protein